MLKACQTGMFPEDEWALSVTRREQTRALCVKMFDLGVKRIYSSPYSRAVATVRPLAEALGIDIEIRNDLRERRLAMGEIDNWREELEKTWLDFDYSLPTGESSRVCQQRGKRACWISCAPPTLHASQFARTVTLSPFC
jgi:2,3-bisphosphoglycerate-dependent phosphoglycerate mutase